MTIVNKAVQSDRKPQQTRKKAVHAEPARKCDLMACVANFLVLFMTCVAGPLKMTICCSHLERSQA